MKKILITLAKIGGASAGIASITIGNVPAVISGISIIASVIASQFSDKPKTKYEWLNKSIALAMEIFNIFALNVDKAENNPKVNR